MNERFKKQRKSFMCTRILSQLYYQALRGHRLNFNRLVGPSNGMAYAYRQRTVINPTNDDEACYITNPTPVIRHTRRPETLPRIPQHLAKTE